MPFINQLEPDALLRQFMRHPPEGFSAADSLHGMPTFATRFDLLTTAEPSMQTRIRGLPGYRHWTRLLHPRTRFIGTTVSEYALLPRQVDARQLAADVVATYARAQPFLIIKDLPQASPLLHADDNTWNEAFVAACTQQGFVMLEGQALAWVPIDFTDTDDYLARLSRGARRDIRRKLRVRDQIQVECVATGSACFQDAGVRAEFHALYAGVFEQSEIHFDRLRPEFLDAVLGDGDSHGVVFVYKHDGRMIGWNLCFEHAGMLVDKYIGFAYPEARDLNLYVVSWMHNLEYARAHGLRFYVAGWTDPAIKKHLGAHLTFTRHAVRPRSRLLRAALRRVSGHFESDRQWQEEHARASADT